MAQPHAAAAPLRVLGICGSLRALSFNRALLRAAAELAPDDLVITAADDLGALPAYNPDLEAAGRPPAVVAFREAIAAADALLIVSPEYNYSIPGPLKNAIDWASRPAADSPLRQKSAAIMGASTGLGGTVRMQMALRQVFLFCQVNVLGLPEVQVRSAAEKFDGDLRLTDEKTRDIVRRQLVALRDWTRRLASVAAVLLGAVALSSVMSACGGKAKVARRDTSAPDASAAMPATAATTGRAACPATGLWDLCTVRERLERAGLAPQPQDDSVFHDFMQSGGAVFTVGGSELQVFIYPDAKALARVITKVDTLNVSVPGQRGDWPLPPTFIRSANMAAILLSSNARQVERVQDALTAGPPPAPGKRP
jgi:chromate reductase, NAD(P)H dehydrogenase (quinone)